MRGVRCERCKKKFKNERGLSVHISHMHPEQDAEPEPNKKNSHEETPPEMAARLRSEGEAMLEKASAIEAAYDDLQSALDL